MELNIVNIGCNKALQDCQQHTKHQHSRENNLTVPLSLSFRWLNSVACCSHRKESHLAAWLTTSDPLNLSRGVKSVLPSSKLQHRSHNPPTCLLIMVLLTGSQKHSQWNCYWNITVFVLNPGSCLHCSVDNKKAGYNLLKLSVCYKCPYYDLTWGIIFKVLKQWLVTYISLQVLLNGEYLNPS